MGKRVGILTSLKAQLAPLARQRDISLLVAARVLLISITLISAITASVLYGGDYAEHMSFIYGPIACLYTFCLASALWLMRQKAGKIFIATQLLVDVATITGIVYLTGGPSSPFLILYLPPVMAAAIVSNRHTALSIALMNAVSYSMLTLALFNRWILTADGTAPVDMASGALALQLIGLVSAMVLIAVLTSFLVQKISQSHILVEKTKSDLFALNSRQQALITSFPEAIISTTLEETVTSMNAAARQLFGVKEEEVIAKSLSSLIKRASKDQIPDSLGGCSQREIEISLPNSPESRTVLCHGRPINNEQGADQGYIFIFQDVTKLRSIEEQLQVQERMARLLATKSAPDDNAPLGISEFVGESPIMQKVFNLITRVAKSDATVLISGESGTGKELVAKAIHKGSTRSRGPFVAVNCGAIPENLIESQLFGHRKGSFTSADSDHVGLFKQADSGTIFLDEIGELPMQMQAKLLRVIQEKQFRPVGGERDIPTNVRIIAATNRNLKKEIESSNFREDLYYRLNVINISLPPLRDRRDDIPLLTNAILQRLVDSEIKPTVSPGAMQLLLNYTYPGNVRELENILERAVVLGGEVILPEHLPENVKQRTESPATSGVLATRPETQILIDESMEFPVNLDAILSKVERHYLELALNKTNGAKKKAAEILGINFRSFRYRLQKFGLNSDDQA